MVGEPAGEPAERGHLRPGALGENARQTDVIGVLVRQHDELEVLDAVPECSQPSVELVQRPPRVRPGVHERERLVLDQPAVHPPDGERGRQCEAMDPRLCRLAVQLVWVAVRGQERMSSSTSSRRRSMSSRETSDSSVSRSSGSVFDARTLKCQSG